MSRLGQIEMRIQGALQELDFETMRELQAQRRLLVLESQQRWVEATTDDSPVRTASVNRNLRCRSRIRGAW